MKYRASSKNSVNIFKKISVTTILLMLLMPTAIAHIQTTSPTTSQTITDTTNQIRYTYQTPPVDTTTKIIDQGTFTQVTLPHYGFTTDVGKPQLPIKHVLLAVPTHDVTLTATYTDTHTRTIPHPIYPVQAPQSDGYTMPVSWAYDHSFYQQDTQYPHSLAGITQQGIIRDIPFIKLSINPVHFNPAQHTLTTYEDITITLEYNAVEPKKVAYSFDTTPFYPIYTNIFSNWDDFSRHHLTYQNTPLFGDTAGCEYLIITHPKFTAAAAQLRTWKHQTGIQTKLVDTQKTGDTAPEIKQYIQKAFDTWTIKPSYILLLGDEEYIPTNYLYEHPYHNAETASDLWYTTVNGSDYYPDIFIGRLSVDTQAQATNLVQKIISYEQQPPTKDTFYQNLTVAGYFQDRNPDDGYEDRRFVKTSEEIRDYLQTQSYVVQRLYVTEEEVHPTNYNDGYYANGEPIPTELLKPTFPWNDDYDDITAAINEGIFILNHRDHGFTYGWGDPYYHTSHIETLTNGDLQPFVFSINCCSGQFDTDDNESFCEVFHRKTPGGAIGVFGASRVSYSGYNDFLCLGFYDAIWPDFDPALGSSTPLYTLGQILNYGKTYMAQTWGSPNTYERITFEMFHCFGDPTMKLWTQKPENLLVTHPDNITSTQGLSITVTDTMDQPVEGALVCVSNPRLYGRGFTNQDGVASFETIEAIPLSKPSSISEDTAIVVTAHNFLPYQAIITAEMQLFGDINRDGKVSVQDLFLLLAAWGDNPGNPADLDANGVVNLRDLILFIVNWK